MAGKRDKSVETVTKLQWVDCLAGQLRRTKVFEPRHRC